MAIPFLNHLDLRSVSELQNAILHKTTENSASDVEGKIIYDTGVDTIKFYNGNEWISLGGDTVRAVGVDTNGDNSVNNTLEASQTLVLRKGTNIGLAEADGVITISSTDTNTQRAAGTGLSLDGNTINANVDSAVQSVAGSNVSATASRTYKVQVDSSDNLVVNVPWVDTDTNTQLSQDDVEDYVAGVVTAGEGIDVAYNDGAGTLTISGEDATTTNKGIASFSTNDFAVNSGAVTIKSGGVSNTQLANSSITINGTAISLGGSTTVSTSDVDVNVANLTARLPQITSDVTIGDATDVTITTSGGLIVTGDLEVKGTTTTVESTVTTFADPIIELNKVVDSGTQANPNPSSGIEVQRAGDNDVQLVWMEDSDDWEFEAYNHAGTPVKKKYKIPTSYKATIGDTSASAGSYSEAITHNLGTKHVIVQCYDTSTFETVYADVVRTSDNVVTLTFASAPTDNDVTVLILSAQGEQS
jgi:hypothetical protein